LKFAESLHNLQLSEASPSSRPYDDQLGVSDHGLTPKAWRNGVITFEVVFEVVSTLGVAAIACARPATRAIAGAYLAQKTIGEAIEAYSGFLGPG
jgi:hypothetical protein